MGWDHATMDLRLKFLKKAGQVMSQNTPSISAHLLTWRAELEDELDMPDIKKDHCNACRACGTISIPGVTSKISMRNGMTTGRIRKSSKRQRKSTLMMTMLSEKSLMTKCLACHRVSKIAIRPSKRQSTGNNHDFRTSNRTKSSTTMNTQGASLITPTVTKPSSRRGKARKKGGLQAFVERSKHSQQTASGTGLDLMDFMKEG